MKKSSIAYVCVSESWGGLEMNQLRNAKWMQERGHTVSLYVLKNSPIHSEATLDQLDVFLVEKHKKYYPLKHAIRLAQLFKQQQVTHVIVRDPKDLSLVGLTKTLLYNKLHFSYFMEMQLGIAKRDLLHTVRFSKINCWSCPLPWLAQQVKDRTRIPHNKITVIPSGLDLTPFDELPKQQEARTTLDLPEDKIIIGLIGRFDPQKGQDLLVSAFSKLDVLIKEQAVILFLGEKTKNEADDYFENLQLQISKSGLDKYIFFQPFRKDVTLFYAAIDWLVMASKSETFGMVTIEALAAGKSIIGSNAGGTPEILEQGKYGYLFESMNAQDLSSALEKAIKHKIFDSDKQRLAASKYNNEKVCELVETKLGLTQ